MRRALDSLYALCLWCSAGLLALIGLMVLIQVLARIVDGVLRTTGLGSFGFIVPSLTEFGGYMLAAASFLALAGTLKHGAHIRITLLLNVLPAAGLRMAELAALLLGGLGAVFAAWQMGVFAYESWAYHEVSYGIIPIPLWVPQLAMTVGLWVMAVAFADEWLAAARLGRPSFAAVEDALLVKE